MTTKKIHLSKKIYWKFMKDDMKFRFNDGRLFEEGKVFSIKETTLVVPCHSGFHASSKISDTLTYREYDMHALCAVRLGGDMEREEDKVAARHIKLVHAFKVKRVFTNRFGRDGNYRYHLCLDLGLEIIKQLNHVSQKGTSKMSWSDYTSILDSLRI